VALYAVESPDNWFEDFGRNKTAGRRKQWWPIDPTFVQSVNTDLDYHVFLTNADCRGLYVARKSRPRFEVRRWVVGIRTLPSIFASRPG